MTQIWYKQLKDDRDEDPGPHDWDKFEPSFLDMFFQLELRKAKVQELIKLEKGNKL